MPAATLTDAARRHPAAAAGREAPTRIATRPTPSASCSKRPKSGAFTVVEGTRIPMHPGDLVMTPNWTWHDHHNESDSHAIWYDGLDVLMAYFLGGVFSQELKDVSGDAYQPEKQHADAVVSCYGPGLRIAGRCSRNTFRRPTTRCSTIRIATPGRRCRISSSRRRATHTTVCVLEYVNPVNGGSTFPTMNTCISMVPGNTRLEARHRTENIIFITMEGSATFHAAGQQRSRRSRSTSPRFPRGCHTASPARARIQRCCSRTPTGRCSRNWASTAKPTSDRRRAAVVKTEEGERNPPALPSGNRYPPPPASG